MSWEHHAIHDIVVVIDPTFADQWPDRFDLVWVFTRSAAGYGFEVINQHLLDGDAP